jgi:chemotaxis protein histidine kinase CheA
MKDIAETLPGLEKIKIRFLALLNERQSEIAFHVLAAWESRDANEASHHLEAAQSTLHQISGSAGSLGFDALGDAARRCENEIIAFVEAPRENTQPISPGIMTGIDAFVLMSQSLLTADG